MRAPCCSEDGLKKGPWSPEEDQKLIDHVEKHGHGSWRALAKNAGLNRCGKSCRLRWINYLKPDIKRGKFSEDEERTIIHLHSVLGNKWSTIAEHLPGRTDNEIKNFWNTKLRKKLVQTGIDPKTHKPIIPDLNLLVSLSHLLNPMMNPLVNSYSYQAEAIKQLAELQLLQNILQVANMCQLPNLAPTYGPAREARFKQSTTNTSQEWVHFRPGELLDNTLPGLVTTSPESSSIVNQMNDMTPTYVPTVPCVTESIVFEGWEKLMDDEAISSFLRDIIVD